MTSENVEDRGNLDTGQTEISDVTDLNLSTDSQADTDSVGDSSFQTVVNTSSSSFQTVVNTSSFQDSIDNVVNSLNSVSSADQISENKTVNKTDNLGDTDLGLSKTCEKDDQVIKDENIQLEGSQPYESPDDIVLSTDASVPSISTSQKKKDSQQKENENCDISENNFSSNNVEKSENLISGFEKSGNVSSSLPSLTTLSKDSEKINPVSEKLSKDKSFSIDKDEKQTSEQVLDTGSNINKTLLDVKDNIFEEEIEKKDSTTDSRSEESDVLLKDPCLANGQAITSNSQIAGQNPLQTRETKPHAKKNKKGTI